MAVTWAIDEDRQEHDELYVFEWFVDQDYYTSEADVPADWVAIGLSRDDKMGDDTVLLANVASDNIVDLYWNIKDGLSR